MFGKISAVCLFAGFILGLFSGSIPILGSARVVLFYAAWICIIIQIIKLICFDSDMGVLFKLMSALALGGLIALVFSKMICIYMLLGAAIILICNVIIHVFFGDR